MRLFFHPSSPDSTLLLDVAVRAFGDGSLRNLPGQQRPVHVTDIVRNSGEVPITIDAHRSWQ